MAVSELRLVKNSVEYLPQKELKRIPKLTRGIYVLYKENPTLDALDVVYIGMAGGEKKAGIGMAGVVEGAGPDLRRSP